MNIDERLEKSGTYSAFRTSLDIGMGAVYIIIAVIVLYMKYFGAVELPASTAYALGSLMLLYGGFRIYRGMVAIFRKRKPRSTSRTE